jgi:hypothetical protein
VKSKKLLKLSNIKGLVLHESVVRILENWEILKSYFVLAVVEGKLKSAEIILSNLNDNIVKTYFLFFKYALNIFNKSALFQSRQILIHKLFENSQQLIH